MEKLKENSKLFHEILYHIWELLAYYADLFGYDVPEAAHQISAKLFQDGTLTKIRVSVPRIRDFEPQYSVLDMRSAMNEYLTLILQNSDLPPFAAGSNYNEITEALYITIVVTDNHYYDFDILYVDNMDAYRVVKDNKVENILWII